MEINGDYSIMHMHAFSFSIICNYTNGMMRITIKYTGLTVRSSRYMVFDKKSIPIVACKRVISLKTLL